MRHACAGALALLAGLLLVPAAGAAPPELNLSLPIGVEFLTPERAERIEGQLTVRFPQDANCPGGMPYGFAVANTTQGVAVDVVTPNGTIAPAQVRPGENLSLPLSVDVTAGRAVVAYSTVQIRVRVITGPCGTLEAAQTTGQTGSRVAFLPQVNLTLVEATASAWVVAADNRGNAAVRFDWALLQPSLGRQLSGGSVDVPGPGNDTTGEIRAPRPPNLDTSAAVILRGQIVYAGDYAWQPEERPATGDASLTLHEPPSSSGQALLQNVLLVGALALIVGGLAAAWWLRRKRP